MVEINRTGVIVGLMTIALILRNVFFMPEVLSFYPKYPFRMNGNFIRCTNAYFSAKGRKPFHRMLFFNIIRCMVPEIVKSIIFRNKVVIWEFNFVLACAVTYTVLFHFLPLSVFKKFKWVYLWL